MKTFDWILLIIAIPWGILSLIRAFKILSHPLYQYVDSRYPQFGIRSWVPFFMLLLIAYRLWA